MLTNSERAELFHAAQERATRWGRPLARKAEIAELAHSTFVEHAETCRECRKRCGCRSCMTRETNRCPRGQQLLEIAAERVSSAIVEAIVPRPNAYW